jgi:hypothetical protein
VGVRTTGALGGLAFDGALMFPESCDSGTDGSSGSMVSISGFVLIVPAKCDNRYVEWLQEIGRFTYGSLL